MLLSGEAGIGKSRLTAALLERARCRASHALALFLLPAAHRQRVLSDHRPDGTRRWIYARRHPASEARQARCRAGAKLRPPRPMPHFLPRCCRCRTTDVIPRSNWPRSSAGKEHWKRSSHSSRRCRAQNSGADDLRGCALDGPHEPGSCSVGWWIGFATLPVLLIVTFRPEFEPPWIGRPYVTALTINRLAQREIEAMIDGVVGNKSSRRASGRTSSSAPTASRCSWRK